MSLDCRMIERPSTGFTLVQEKLTCRGDIPSVSDMLMGGNYEINY